MEDQVITSYHRMPGFFHLESLGGSWCDEWSSISAILSNTPPGGWTMESEGNLVDRLTPHIAYYGTYTISQSRISWSYGKSWSWGMIFFTNNVRKSRGFSEKYLGWKWQWVFWMIFVYAYNQVPCVSWNLPQGSRPSLQEERDPWEVSIRVDEIQF